MRTSLRSKLILSTAIAGLIITPTALAHGRHGGSADAGRREGFAHHRFASADNRTYARNGAHISNGNDRNLASADAVASNGRRHERIPDEEELAQPEQ